MRLFASIAFCCLVLCAIAPAADETDELWDRARTASGAEAVKLYAELVQQLPNSHVARYEYAEALYLVGEHAVALENYQRAIDLGKDPGIGYTRIGKTLEKLDRIADAEVAYRKALKTAPDAVAAEFGLASALYRLEKSAEALSLFEKLAKRDDDWGEVAREYIPELLYDLKRYDAAAAGANAMLEKHADNVALRWVLARSLFKQQRFAEAEAEFRKLADDPKRGEAARYYIAASLEGQGRSHEAERTYREISGARTDWGRAADQAARALAGKPYFIVLDYLGGYDTDVVQTTAQGAPSAKTDYFNQIYADIEGRVLRSGDTSVWLGAEHFGLHYPEAHENDYFQDGVRAAVRVRNAGPFEVVTLRYSLRYSQLDYESYRKEHRVDANAVYDVGPNRLRFGLSVADNKYFRSFSGFDGPDTTLFVDYTRRLPLWDHEVRLRTNLEYRWTQDDSQERFMQRIRLQYRASMTNKLAGMLELGYRREDFPQSQRIRDDGEFLPQRTDHRLTGEARFTRDINRHLSVNWGYIYESQDSRRPTQEFGRHEISAGFTVTF